jgi:Mlc titration factor MtfA (ptsG expression regulator)
MSSDPIRRATPKTTRGRRPTPAAWRLANGAWPGLILGLLVFAASAPARYTTLPWRASSPWSMLVGAILGGALAGAWVGWLLPAMRRRTVAVGVGLSAAAIYVAVTWLCGATWTDAPLIMVAAPFAGSLMGLLAREVSPDVISEVERDADALQSPAARLSGWIVSLAEELERRRGAEDRGSAERRPPFPTAWEEILGRNLPPYVRLAEPERERLHALVLDFVARKSFEGAGGQEMDDEVRVTIAGQACMLALGFRAGHDPYADLRSIVVYPSSYAVPDVHRIRYGQVNSEPEGRLGESWAHGTVVLSWEDVVAGAADPADGRNLVFHEFAHQLDQQTGAADGVPVMATVGGARSWARLLHAELERLREGLDAGREDVLRDYGATNEPEFFAVATETFFERPGALRAEHPELYGALRVLYNFDPEAMRPVTAA